MVQEHWEHKDENSHWDLFVSWMCVFKYFKDKAIFNTYIFFTSQSLLDFSEALPK